MSDLRRKLAAVAKENPEFGKALARELTAKPDFKSLGKGLQKAIERSLGKSKDKRQEFQKAIERGVSKSKSKSDFGKMKAPKIPKSPKSEMDTIFDATIEGIEKKRGKPISPRMKKKLRKAFPKAMEKAERRMMDRAWSSYKKKKDPGSEKKDKGLDKKKLREDYEKYKKKHPKTQQSFPDYAKAQQKQAGWWGDVPLDGDAPLDLLHAVENKDPKKGAAEVLKELKSREFADRYAAMGVWDAVMTTKAEPYYTLFSKLTPAVIRAAKKGVPEDDDWAYSQTVAKYLKSYAQGKPTRRPGRTKFRPKTKDAWYIDSMYVAGMSGVADLEVTMRNRWTGETKEIEETISDGEDWDRVRGENYGGKNDRRQQSILLTFERDDKTGQVQIEVDPATGEFREDSFDDWSYEENW